MIVLSDTTPINHLVLAGYVNVLPALFQNVAIPTAVRSDSAPRHAGGRSTVDRSAANMAYHQGPCRELSRFLWPPARSKQ